MHKAVESTFILYTGVMALCFLGVSDAYKMVNGHKVFHSFKKIGANYIQFNNNNIGLVEVLTLYNLIFRDYQMTNNAQKKGFSAMEKIAACFTDVFPNLGPLKNMMTCAWEDKTYWFLMKDLGKMTFYVPSVLSILFYTVHKYLYDT